MHTRHASSTEGKRTLVGGLTLLLTFFAFLFAAAVAQAAPPANDDIANAEALTGANLTAAGSSVDATAEAGEPDHAGTIAAASVWYSWTAPTDGAATIDLDGSDFDTRLAVYTEGPGNTLNLVAENDDTDPFNSVYTSSLTFLATESTEYLIAVDGYGGETGNIALALDLEDTGSITGQAVEFGSGDPLMDICVDAFSAPGVSAGDARTDASGRFTIEDLEAGDYRVLFRDCNDLHGVNSQWFDGEKDYLYATAVTVTVGGTPPDVNASLGDANDTGLIAGHVTDTNGDDLEDICVNAEDVDHSSGTSVWQTRTAADGTWEVSPPQGEYTVFFTDCGGNGVADQYWDGQTDPDDADVVQVEGGNRTSGIDAEMGPLGSISGHVENSAGDPLEDICVEVFSESTNTDVEEPTDVNGDYTIADLPPANDYYAVFVECGGPDLYAGQFYDGAYSPFDATAFAVTGGADTPNIDATMEGYGTISGTVTADDTGLPLEDVSIAVYTPEGIPVAIGFTDEFGNYTVEGVPPGDDFIVDACDCSGDYVGQFYDGVYDPDDATPVVVQPDTDTPDIDFSLELAGTITGNVTDEDDQPIEDICVTAYDEDEFPIDSINTDVNGDYELSGFLDEDVYVEFYDCAGDYVTEWFDDQPDFLSSDPVATTIGNNTPNIDAELIEVGPPVGRSFPKITGTLDSGETLTAAHGAWYRKPDSYSYDWQRCNATLPQNCTSIGAPDQDTYLLTNADIGKRITVRVTATNSYGSTDSNSPVTRTVGLPVPTAKPVITGQAQPGETLTSSTGDWSGPAATYSYDWQSCNATAPLNCTSTGAPDQNTYALTSADVGKKIRVRVTATNDAGSASSDSAPTAKVGIIKLITKPVISGTAKVGQTLTSTPGSWTGSPTIAFDWVRCSGSAVSTCTSIGAPDQATYQPTNADLNQRIRVLVTASNATDTASEYTAATAVIKP